MRTAAFLLPDIAGERSPDRAREAKQRDDTAATRRSTRAHCVADLARGRAYDPPMPTHSRLLPLLGITVAALIGLGYFIAAMGPVTYVRAYNEPGIPGKYDYHFVMGFAVALGWAVLEGVEAVWRSEKDHDAPWTFANAAAPRLLAGVVLFFTVVFIAFGFEAAGVGLGGH